MDVTITGRNVTLTDRFRSYAEDKLGKIESLADRALATEVKVSSVVPSRGNAGDARVELTLVGPGPVVRAESEASDKFVAFDLAYEKLLERVRRSRDKRKISKGRRDKSIGEHSHAGFADIAVQPASPESLGTGPIAVVEAEEVDPYDVPDYSPMVIRRKHFQTRPITLDDALSNMELVGHDFYLFVDAETDKPSVVYRRKGWDYGVITLDVE